MTSVLIVGAGIAGLAAAYRLREAGFDVSVVDAGPAPGGRMADLDSAGIAYNSGARLIYPFGRDLHALIRDLNLRDALVPLRDLSALCRVEGREYALELMPSLRALGTPGLTVGDRLRLLAFGLRLGRLRWRVDPDDIATAAIYDGETLAGYADRVLGPRVRARFLDPLFRGTRSWNCDDISPAFLLATLPHMLGRRTVYAMSGGMGRLTRELASRLGVRRDARVVGVAVQPEGGCRTDFADGGVATTDLVVVAVEGARALTLLAEPTPQERRFLTTVRYNSLGVVHYALEGDVPPLLRFIDRSEGGTLATYQQLPAAPGAGRAVAQLYCQLTPEATRAARACGRTMALETMIHDDVKRLFPDLDRRATGHVEQWIEHKLPVPYPGFVTELTTFNAWQDGTRRRVYLCGDYLAQALVTGAAASGVRTARLVARHWRP